MRRVVWHMEEPRVGQSLSQLLCGEACEPLLHRRSVGRGRRRNVRRLSVALLPRRRNSDFDEYVDEILRLLAAAVPGRGSFGHIRARSATEADTVDPRAHLSRRFRRSWAGWRRPRTASTARSISRRRRFCTACSSLRTSSAWRTALETRVPFLDTIWSISRCACRCAMKLANLHRDCARRRERTGRQGHALFRAHARRQAAVCAR